MIFFIVVGFNEFSELFNGVEKRFFPENCDAFSFASQHKNPLQERRKQCVLNEKLLALRLYIFPLFSGVS